jgi:hypothetical protein
MVGESRAPNVIVRMAGHLGVGEGQMYLRSRVMPVEGRALTSGVLAKEEGDVDWRKPENTDLPRKLYRQAKDNGSQAKRSLVVEPDS